MNNVRRGGQIRFATASAGDERDQAAVCEWGSGRSAQRPEFRPRPDLGKGLGDDLPARPPGWNP